jgi:hypothetical protein
MKASLGHLDRLRIAVSGLAFLALGGLLTLTLIVSHASAVPAYPGPRCEANVTVRDYLEPLGRMAPIQEPPASGEIPFAPPLVKLAISGEKLIADDGLVGFSLNYQGDKPRRLDWIVEIELLKVNRRGVVISSVDVKRWRVLSTPGYATRDLLHRVSGAPAFYRVDIRFIRKGIGRLLGAYSTYARLIKARAGMRMEIETPAVFAGEYARATLVNLGTVPIELSVLNHGFNVEVFSEGRWSRVPHNPRILEPKLRRRARFLAVGAQSCLRYLVPDDQVPGLFRFTARGRYGEDWSDLVEAEFAVEAP